MRHALSESGARAEGVMVITAEEHRALATSFMRLAEFAPDGPEQRNFLRLAQEHLLLVHPDPLMIPFRDGPARA